MAVRKRRSPSAPSRTRTDASPEFISAAEISRKFLIELVSGSVKRLAVSIVSKSFRSLPEKSSVLASDIARFLPKTHRFSNPVKKLAGDFGNMQLFGVFEGHTKVRLQGQAFWRACVQPAFFVRCAIRPDQNFRLSGIRAIGFYEKTSLFG
jgi:hypothetical protein